jgi:hypothetical protein
MACRCRPVRFPLPIRGCESFGVIRGLTAWFGLHVLFGKSREIVGHIARPSGHERSGGSGSDAGGYHGMIPVLAACAAAGVLCCLAVGVSA